MIERLLNVPTYYKGMHLDGYTPQEIYAAGKQHFYELTMLEKEVPKAIDDIIEQAVDDVLGKWNK